MSISPIKKSSLKKSGKFSEQKYLSETPKSEQNSCNSSHDNLINLRTVKIKQFYEKTCQDQQKSKLKVISPILLSGLEAKKLQSYNKAKFMEKEKNCQLDHNSSHVIDIKQDNVQEFDKFCRICKSQTYIEDIVQPCECSDITKYCHQECLRSWIEYSKNSRCEICNYNYKVKISTQKSVCVYFKSQNSNFKEKLLSLLFLLIIISFIPILIYYGSLITVSIKSIQLLWFMILLTVFLTFCQITYKIVIYPKIISHPYRYKWNFEQPLVNNNDDINVNFTPIDKLSIGKFRPQVFNLNLEEIEIQHQKNNKFKSQSYKSNQKIISFSSQQKLDYIKKQQQKKDQEKQIMEEQEKIQKSQINQINLINKQNVLQQQQKNILQQQYETPKKLQQQYSQNSSPFNYTDTIKKSAQGLLTQHSTVNSTPTPFKQQLNNQNNNNDIQQLQQQGFSEKQLLQINNMVENILFQNKKTRISFDKTGQNSLSTAPSPSLQYIVNQKPDLHVKLEKQQSNLFSKSNSSENIINNDSQNNQILINNFKLIDQQA